MTTDEAQEAAWREWAGIDHTHAVARTAFTAGWDARGQHDKEQIAALVEAVRRAHGYHATIGITTNGSYVRVVPFDDCGIVVCALARKFAGQSEEATG